MLMVVPEYTPVDGQLWRVTRVRASIRAGEASVKDVLDGLGVLGGPGSGSSLGIEHSRGVAV